ncbi:hypothetical protein ACHAWF_014300 [Thalassiosira exigua]
MIMAINNDNGTNKRPLPGEDHTSPGHQPATSKRRESGFGQHEGSSGQEESRALKSILAGAGDDDDDDATISTFFETIWQVAPRVYRRNKAEDAGCPLERAVNLGWDGLATLLERSRKRFARTTTTAAAGTLDPPLFFRNQTPVQFPEVQSVYNSSPFAAYLDGCSIVLNHADELSPRLAALCEDLQQSIPHCYCNGYLTPPGAQAVPPHADDRDVFVIQLLGEKVWKVYQNVPVPLPYPKEQVGKGGVDVPTEILEGATAIETTLRQGDVLYMPRGYVHEARTESNQPSFHATVAMATHDWTLAGNMTEMISRIMASNRALRLAVDRHVGNDNAATDGRELSSLQAQIDAAVDEIRKKVTAGQIARQLRVKYSTQKEMCHGARIALVRDIHANQNAYESDALVGPDASRRIFMGTTVRAATDEERASVKPPPRPAGAASAASDRGLTVREETSLPLMTIVQRLKRDKSLKMKVSELRSLFDQSDIDESSRGMVCSLSILSFIRAAVELGAVAIEASLEPERPSPLQGRRTSDETDG